MERVYMNGEHSSHIMNSMTKLWQENKYCDAVLEISKEKLQLHKLILLAASPSVLNIVDYTDTGGVITITLPGDIYSMDAARICMQYLYKGVAKITNENIESVTEVAQFLDLKEMLTICSSFKEMFDASRELTFFEGLGNTSKTDGTNVSFKTSDSYEDGNTRLESAVHEVTDSNLELTKTVGVSGETDVNMEAQVKTESDSYESSILLANIDSLVIKKEPDLDSDTRRGEVEARVIDQRVQSDKRAIENPNDCQICKKVFTKKNGLYRHIRRTHHQSEELSLYKCQYCGQTFRFKYNAVRHERIVHQKCKFHTCTLCGDAFGTKIQLQGHLRSCHDFAKFQCSDCSKSFGFLSNLKEHKRICKGQDQGQSQADGYRFQCEKCEKSFQTRRYLKAHENFKHGPGTGHCVCELCGEKFSCKYSLKRHTNRKHVKLSRDI